MQNDDDFRKHLDLIQGVINRLASNSFSVKTWAIGLIAVLGGLATKDADARLASALLFPAFCFWALDAYYLREERLFRKLYEQVVMEDSAVPRYSMNTASYEHGVPSVGKTAFSASVIWLHIPIVIFVLVLIAYSATHRRNAVTPATPAVKTNAN